MPPDEFRGPVAPRLSADAEGLVVQEAADVLGQRRHRRVAAARLLLEGLREDVIDVAAICPAQAVGRSIAPHRTLGSFL